MTEPKKKRGRPKKVPIPDITAGMNPVRADRALRRQERLTKVELIADMMRKLTWRTGKTVYQLAKDWNMRPATVAGMASDAAKKVREEVQEDAGYFLSLSMQALEKVLLGALDGTGDQRNVVNAARTAAEIIGVRAPRKVEQKIETTEADNSDLEKKNKAELVAELEQLLRQEKEKLNDSPPQEDGTRPLPS